MWLPATAPKRPIISDKAIAIALYCVGNRSTTIVLMTLTEVPADRNTPRTTIILVYPSTKSIEIPPSPVIRSIKTENNKYSITEFNKKSVCKTKSIINKE